MFRLIARLLGLIASLATLPSLATDIPAPLVEWKPWVLNAHQDLSCPLIFNSGERHCVWHSGMSIDVKETGASFTQRVDVFKNAWIALPGNVAYWPEDVLDSNAKIAVRDNNGVPEVYLITGSHELTGNIHWSETPRTLTIPAATSLIQLTLNGKNVAAPAIENNNQLWLTATNNQATITHQDELNVRVYRKIDDAVPLRITTQLHLDVSGKEREIQLGQLLLSQFTALELQSPLPARIEKNGDLRIQIKPGSWVLTLISQSTTPLNEIKFTKTTDLWPEEEIWVFSAARELRSVQISGAPTIDPQQTELPDDWKHLPAYLMVTGTVFKIEELQRGDAVGVFNELQLNRRAWLSFNGDHFTIADSLTGNTHRSRLETIAPVTLTSATIGGEPQLITHLAETVNTGLEIRNRTLDLIGVSELARSLTIPVTGWNADFNHVMSELYLPPGWSLLTATGASTEEGTWIAQWTLWDMFILFIIVAAIARLTKPLYGALAAITLILIYHRTGAPVFIWIHLILAIALITYASGKLNKFIHQYAYVSFFVLALIVLPFSAREARLIINPQLENEPFLNLFGFESSAHKKSSAAPQILQAKVVEEDAMAQPYAEAASPPVMSSIPRGAMKAKRKYDSNQQTQTGLAVPNWYYNTVNLTWSGPITAVEKTTLFLVSPLFNRIGNLLSALLPLLLSYLFIRHFLSITTKTAVPTTNVPTSASAASVLTALLVTGIFLAPLQQANADVNIDASLLAELEKRLTEAPPCLPSCAAIESVHVSVNRDLLNIEITAHATELIALPLPGDREQWWPNQVTVDGKNATLVQASNGSLLVNLTKGRHSINLKAQVQGRDTLNISFPIALHNTTVTATGWEASGIPTAEQQSQSLQLQRVERDETATQSEHLRPEPIAPFVTVRRALKLDVEWSVTTTITRVAPAFGAINLEVPIIDGEAPLTTVLNANGKVAVHFEANQSEVEWTSSLKQISPISLQAAQEVPWVEIWSLETAPMWHTEITGIASIQLNNAENLPIWQPWPSERLSIQVSRPEATKGNYITIDSATLALNLGERSNTNTLTLEVRANQGGQYGFTLPSHSTFVGLEVNQQPVVISANNNELKIPLSRGKQSIAIKWNSEQGLALLSRSPEFNLEGGSSNQSIRIELPQNRWPLLLGGPSMGPSVLIWGMLFVVVIVAWGLGRSRLTPLKSYEWIVLSLGICTLSFFTFVLVALWMLALQQRGKLRSIASTTQFQIMQAGLFLLSFAALACLISTIPQGLLGTPDMYILGNNSSNYFLNWYQDYSERTFPNAWIISLPLWCYKLVILVWSLWLASALLRWLRWGWEQLNQHGLWHASASIIKPAHNNKSAKLNDDELPNSEPNESATTTAKKENNGNNDEMKMDLNL